MPDPQAHERELAVTATKPGSRGGRLPKAFWTYAAFTAATTTGFATFGVLSFHLVERHLVTVAWVPVLYAAAMGVDAVAALATGWLYDRHGPRVLVALPVLTVAVAGLGFTETASVAVAMGIRESTLRATIADLVPGERRATAYGLFAGVVYFLSTYAARLLAVGGGTDGHPRTGARRASAPLPDPPHS